MIFFVFLRACPRHATANRSGTYRGLPQILQMKHGAASVHCPTDVSEKAKERAFGVDAGSCVEVVFEGVEAGFPYAGSFGGDITTSGEMPVKMLCGSDVIVR